MHCSVDGDLYFSIVIDKVQSGEEMKKLLMFKVPEVFRRSLRGRERVKLVPVGGSFFKKQSF